jgi:homoserine kinase
MPDNVLIRVPATTGNLGSGFDCVGMALALYNEITFKIIESGLKITIVGEGAQEIPINTDNVCIRAANRVFDKIGWRPTGLSVHMNHAIPVSRGLGSSGVAIVGGAVGANELAGQPLPTTEIMKICSDLEGHPDNVVPSLLGGLSISGERENTIIYQTYQIQPPLKAVVAIPEFTLDTKTARQALPSHVTMDDAVFNLCSVGLLIGSLISGRYENLRSGMADRLHQPFREPLIPGLSDVVQTALDMGAHGAALSGAGPTAIALATEHFEEIGQGMSSAFEQHQIKSQIRILNIDNLGCQIDPS